MIRLVENNDWVIFTLLGLVAMCLVMFYWLLRGISVWEYLMQGYKETQNSVLTWLLTSVGFVVVFSLLFSQYIPVVPRVFLELEIEGWVPNKIGSLLLVLCGYYGLKFILTAIFYASIGQIDKILVLGFVAQRFYYVQAVLLMIMSVFHYYYFSEDMFFYPYYEISVGVILMLKNILYFFHKEHPLPNEWYYKILYICTLQILPLLAMWKFIFL